MFTRRNWLVALGASALSFFIAPPAKAIEVAKFRDRLQAGLKTRTQAERAFVNRVVDMVIAGELEKELVDKVFFWARKKAEKKGGLKAKRPMIYFQPAMTRLIAKIKSGERVD